jgi:hypothetical protein
MIFIRWKNLGKRYNKIIACARKKPVGWIFIYENPPFCQNRKEHETANHVFTITQPGGGGIEINGE